MTGRESHLHRALKDWYMREGDACEARTGDFIADILRPANEGRGRDLIIEIQTGSFSKLAAKLPALLKKYALKVVYPLVTEKRIILYDQTGKKILRTRKSPRHDSLYTMFNELFRIPGFLRHEFFEFEVVFTAQEEVRISDGNGSWRKKGVSVRERRLVEVADTKSFRGLADYAKLIPRTLQGGFTCSGLSAAVSCPRKLAQKMAYCLSRAGLLESTGKEGRERRYIVRDLKIG